MPPPALEKSGQRHERDGTPAEHIHYAARAAEGGPVGSGAMESLCGQLQRPFQTGRPVLDRAGATTNGTVSRTP